MSANNELFIHRRGLRWVVSDRDVDIPESLVGTPIGTARTLKGAIKIANNYPGEVEYGLRIELTAPKEGKDG